MMLESDRVQQDEAIFRKLVEYLHSWKASDLYPDKLPQELDDFLINSTNPTNAQHHLRLFSHMIVEAGTPGKGGKGLPTKSMNGFIMGTQLACLLQNKHGHETFEAYDTFEVYYNVLQSLEGNWGDFSDENKDQIRNSSILETLLKGEWYKHLRP